MIFEPLTIPGAHLLRAEPIADERGHFARTFCQSELAAHGLDSRIAQASVSYNHRRSTLRGMHWQREPFAETKIVSCLRGAVYDVMVDLRPDSSFYCRWIANFLTEDDGCGLYVPRGVAHGFITLAEETVLSYQISERHSAAHSEGVRWDDPAFAIRWPTRNPILSERDRSYRDFVPDRAIAPAH